MDKKINWKLQGRGGAYNLSVEGIKLPTLRDYEKYIGEILFSRDEKLIDDSSIELGEGFLLYSENLNYKVITFFWKNKPVIVDPNNFKDVFKKLREEERFESRRTTTRSKEEYMNTLQESVEEIRF